MIQWQDDDQRWSSWLAQAQAGNEESYTQLLTELADVIRAYLIRRLGYSDALEDYVQEALMAIHSGRSSYDPNRPFRAWMFAIVRHKTIDCLRKGKYVKAQELEIFLETNDEEFDLTRTLDRTKLMAQLSNKLSEPLYLTKVIGLSQAECAQHLGISVSAVKVRVFRAIRQLKSQWNDAN